MYFHLSGVKKNVCQRPKHWMFRVKLITWLGYMLYGTLVSMINKVEVNNTVRDPFWILELRSLVFNKEYN